MKRLVPIVLIAFVLFIAGLWLVRGAQKESPIVDETPHLTAGYSYLHFLDYRLNPEHPPLTKAVSAALLDGAQLGPDSGVINFPSENPAWTDDVNGQWTLGKVFLFGSGNDGQAMVARARLGAITITLVFILFFAGWLWKRFGAWWGVLGATLLGFSPYVLGHGNLITTDVAAALGALVGIVAFGWYLHKTSSWKRALVAGVAFGFASLCKFSLVLLIPSFLIVALVYVFAQNRHGRDADGEKKNSWKKKVWLGVRHVLVVVVIGYAVVVYPVYAVFTHNYPGERQYRDTQFILGSFASGTTPAGHFCKPVRCVADVVIWASNKPVVRPFAEYALGVLMVVQRADGGNTSYFLGQVSSAGSTLYFPVVYLAKETLPLLVLLLVAAVYGVWLLMGRLRSHRFAVFMANVREWTVENPTEALMAVFVLIYWASSIRSSLNIGVRHLIPVIPLMYILAVRGWKAFGERHHSVRNYGGAALAVIALGQFVAASAASPYFLPYYNPLVGGTANGYRIATDSNYDWGQDLITLKTWLDAHPEVDKIAVDYFGGGDVPSYLGSRAVPWQSSDGNPANKGIHWLAVSVSVLQNAMQPTVAGQPRGEADEYRWLQKLRPRGAGLGAVPPPDDRAGTGLFVYRVE